MGAMAKSAREKAQPQTFWERCAMMRWGMYATEVERNLILTALSKAGPPGYALDVGCDGGRWSRLLAEFGWELTCTDVNERSLQVCQVRNPKALCVLVKNTDKTLPCSTNSNRLVLCIEVWPIVHADWFLAEVSRILEPGGLLVITCSNRLSWRGLYSAWQGKAAQYYSGTYTGWKRRLQSYNLFVEREEGYAWFPFGRLSDSRLIPLCVEGERILRLRHLTAISPWIAVIARKSGTQCS